MDPSTAGGAADVVYKYGGWGLAFLMVPLIVWLGSKVLSLRDEWAKAETALATAHAAALAQINKDHAAEIARLNDKRIEDVRAVLSALGTFDVGRAAIVDAVEKQTEAIEANTSILADLKEKFLEVWHRLKGGG